MLRSLSTAGINSPGTSGSSARALGTEAEDFLTSPPFSKIKSGGELFSADFCSMDFFNFSRGMGINFKLVYSMARVEWSSSGITVTDHSTPVIII